MLMHSLRTDTEEVFPFQNSLSVEAENYKNALLEAIDEGLKQILGESATYAVYFHIEQKYYLKRKDIPNNLEDFHLALEEIFGFGALLIEKAIMENLYSRLSINSKNLLLQYSSEEQFNFINYINDLKQQLYSMNGDTVRKKPSHTKKPIWRNHI